MANDKKGLIVLGGVGLGLFLLARNSNASGNNPSVPPAPSDPNDTSTDPATQTTSQITWIYNMLQQHGFESVPLWYNATSTPTEIPQDTTGAGRNLVAKDQSVTDLYQGFFWNVHTFFGWNYPAGAGNSAAVAPAGSGAVFPGLTGANTQTPTTDPTDWATMQSQYAQLTQVLTPTFLA